MNSPTWYRPEFERDSCGFGLIAQMDNKPSHWLVKTSINSLARLTHRGAVAADGKSGDGCGLLMKKPDGFLRAVAAEAGFTLTAEYGVGTVFLNTDPALAQTGRAILDEELAKEGLQVAGWRVMPVDPDACGDESRRTMPRIEQVFVNAPEGLEGLELERRLYLARRRAGKRTQPNDPVYYVVNLSGRVLSYNCLLYTSPSPRDCS